MNNLKEKIIELRKQEFSMKKIAKELNCAVSTVSYHCKMKKIGGYSDRLSE